MYLNTTIVKDASKENQDQSQMTLDFSLKQLLSLKNIEQLVNTPSVTKLLLSTNYLKEIEPVINEFSNLTDLDMSINQISKIQNFTYLDNLLYLNLSNNRIRNIEGLSKLQNLQYLDLSMNYLTKLENLRLFNLRTLIVSGNDIPVIENLHHLENLECLEMEKCGITNLDNLIIYQFKHLKKIAFGFNAVSMDYLDDFCALLKVIPSIEEVILLGNEITLNQQYKIKIMEIETVKVLDKLALKDPIRRHFQKLRHEQNIEGLVQDSKKEYDERLEKEKKLKEATLQMIEEQKRQVEQIFSEYEGTLSKDYEKLLEKAKELRTKRANGEVTEEDTEETIQQWTKAVKEKAIKKREEYEDALKSHDRKQKEYLETALNDKKFTDKLYEISMKQPEVWKDIKIRERIQYEKEEEEIEKMKKQYLDNDESEIQQYENLAGQIQTSMIKDIADTVLDYEAKELTEQRTKAANVLKRALLKQMVGHYAGIRKSNLNELQNQINERNEEYSQDEERPLNEVTEADLRDMLSREYQDGEFQPTRKKKKKKTTEPQDLSQQDINSMLGVKNSDQSYSQAIRSKKEIERRRKEEEAQLMQAEMYRQMLLQQQHQQAQQIEQFENQPNQYGQPQYQQNGPPYDLHTEELEKDPFEQSQTYVNPEHVVGEKNGEKIIFIPFPEEEEQPQKIPESKQRLIEEAQMRGQIDQVDGGPRFDEADDYQDEEPRKKKKKKKKKKEMPNLLDELEHVDDNGLPEQKFPEYQPNQPYNITLPEKPSDDRIQQQERKESKELAPPEQAELNNQQKQQPQSKQVFPEQLKKVKKTSRCNIF